MKNDNVLKTPQLLTKHKLRTENEVKIKVTDDDGQPTVRIQRFSHKDEFGWGFPEVEPEEKEKKKHVVDMNWLNDYNDEIDRLQIVIKKERSLSFNSESGNLLERRSSAKSEPVSELEESFNSTHTYEIEIPCHSIDDQSIEDTNIGDPTSRKLSFNTDTFFLQVNKEELCSSTPAAENFCSIRNCPSRDSGISAFDETLDTLPEVSLDTSLLAELEGVYGTSFKEDKNVKSVTNAQAVQHNSSHPIPKDRTEISEDGSLRKCPVWYKRFSIGQSDLILNFNSLNWGLESEFVEEEEEEVELSSLVSRKDDQFDSLISKSDKESNISDDSIEATECINERRRRSIKELWTVCDKLEASSLREGRTIKALPEIMDLVKCLNKIDDRVEILKGDLQSLTRQASEQRNELNTLQKRTNHLLSSTETSRYHMTQLFGLERLEERLQEEWWAVHYPDLVKIDGNYIV